MTTAPDNPYPGLRPFGADESYLFFGRGEHTDALLKTLRSSRFLAVVGYSGSGKSSLVGAGMLPALYGGFMAGAGSDWRVAITRPGGQPMANLAAALAGPEALGGRDGADGMSEIERDFLRMTLTRSRSGLVRAVRQARLGTGTNVLVLIDQFEEIFRFSAARRDQAIDQAAAFVELLLEAARQQEVPIYVVLTMRSDFLGDCAQFPGLPEAINRGQYLVPRLSRRQLGEVIRGPAGVGGARLTHTLLQRLLNDVGDLDDQLPILQHALMRTYDHWTRHRRGPEEPIDLDHYEAIGGMAEALSRHAEEALGELDEDGRALAARIFKALTERGPDGRGIRRPTSIEALCAIVDVDAASISAAIVPFRAPGRAFVMPPADHPLQDETVVDLAHESLMRVWGRLAAWVEAEAEAARLYRHLAEAAQLHSEGAGGVWRDPELQLAARWREDNNPNKAWADRYAPGYERAIAFLETSQGDQDRARKVEARRRRREILFARAIAASIAVALVVAIVFVFASRRQNAEIRRQSAARQSRELAFLSARQLGLDYDRALLLAIEAVRVSPSETAEDALRDALLARGRTTHRMLGHQGGVTDVAWSPDGRWLVGASNDGSVQLHDSTSGELRAALLGHQGPVKRAVWSPDGRWIATASFDGTARVFDGQDGSSSSVFEGHVAVVEDVAWSPAGDRVVSVSADGTARMWDARNGEPIRTFTGHSDFVVRVRWQGPCVATASLDRSVRVWDADTGEVLAVWPHDSRVRLLAWHPRRAIVATGGDDGLVRLWPSPSRCHRSGRSAVEARRLAGHSSWITSLAFSPDGDSLLSSSRDGTVRVWDVQTGGMLQRIDAGPGEIVADVVAATWSPQADHIAVVSPEGGVGVYRTADARRVATLTGHRDGVLSVAWDPSGARIATGGGDRETRIWDPGPGVELATLDVGSPVLDASWDHTGSLLATADGSGGVVVWDTATGRPLERLSGHPGGAVLVHWGPQDRRVLSAGRDAVVHVDVVGRDAVGRDAVGRSTALAGHGSGILHASWSPSGSHVATGGFDRILRIWEAASGSLVHELHAHEGWIRQVVWDAAGQRLLSAGTAGSVYLWTLDSDQPVRRFDDGGSGLWDVAWRPDGRRFAAVGSDRVVRVWDVETGELVQRLLGHDNWVWEVAWSPDGTRIATASRDGTARIWTLRGGGTAPHVLAGGAGPVRRIAWSHDGSRLLTGGVDGSARVFSAQTGAEISVLGSSGGPISQVAWSADGALMMTASLDGWVKIHYGRLEDLLAAACRNAIRNLTVEEWHAFVGGTYRATCSGLPFPEVD